MPAFSIRLSSSSVSKGTDAAEAGFGAEAEVRLSRRPFMVRPNLTLTRPHDGLSGSPFETEV